ncbi:MAG: glycoside hydrolase family 2 TIM barrel-domain containing protein [Solirubrobacteraceae bacterium]
MRAGLLGAAALSFDVGLPAATRAGSTPPAEGASREIGLNQGWLFGGVYAPGAEVPGHSERHFVEVTLPHTVAPLSWGDWDPRTWEHRWIYRRHIAGAPLVGGRVFVDFQGVMTSATVFLNGQRIARHDGGYLPWSVELTQHLTPRDNVLAVVVDSRQLDVPPDRSRAGARAVDFLQPGGIYRDVALRVAPAVLVSDVFAQPTDVLSGAPGVDVQVTIDAAYLPAGRVTVGAAVLDGPNPVGSAGATVTLKHPGETVVALSITGLTGLTLWSPDTPQLYQVQATVTADGVSHAIQVSMGFREARFELDGFYLNGERLQIIGLNRHQLFPYTGMAAPERLQRRDAELLRHELGCNMVRCSHYPQSPHFLDACDELGLMVWEEPPGWQYVGDQSFQEIVVRNVHDMVMRDRNRPSVIIWGTRLDETTSHPVLYAHTRRLARTLDGSRQSSGAMNTHSTSGWAEDVFAYNDYHSEDGAAILEPPLPGVPYLVSEAVGVRDGAPLYRWVDSGATLAQQASRHAQVNAIARTNTAYAGVLAWAGIDYASLSGGVRAWHNLKWAGVLDTFRVPKPGAAFYRSQVDPATAPIVLPVFFWDFGPSSPPDGPGANTMIATNCDSLQIFVDGALLTTAAPDPATLPQLAYPPVLVDLMVDGTSFPELRVDGYVGGQLATSLHMSSDPAQDSLMLTVEDEAIQGDGTDATRFTFRAVDAFGNQRPYAEGDVALILSGPGQLVAENPFSFATYGGVGGGLIQSRPDTSGTVTVTATHPSLGQARASVTVQPAASAGASLVPGSAPPLMNPLRSPSGATVRAALAAALPPNGVVPNIPKLLRHGGYTFAFAAPFAGELAIHWWSEPEAGGGPRGRAARRKLVAAAVASMKTPGRIEVKLQLTGHGRRRLRHAQQPRLTAVASFTPSGRPTTTSSAALRLDR